MQSWRAIPSFYCPSFGMKRTRIWICSSLVSCCLGVLIGHRVTINSVVQWHKSCWNHVPENVRVRRSIRAMMLMNRTVWLIVTGNALGFFKESGSVISFSVELSDFCRTFTVESNTTIKIFIGDHVLVINEMHKVIERNSVFEILARIWYKIIFWTQNRMDCKLCRIIRRDLCFIVAVHRFLQREKLFNFDKFEHWVLIVSRYWWETSPLVGYVRSWKKRAAIFMNDF